MTLEARIRRSRLEMIDERRLYVVCYDISSDKVRTKLANSLLDIGAREQNSVFEVRISEDGLACLLQMLASVEIESEDSITVYPIHKDAIGSIVRYGKEPPEFEDVLVF